MTLLFSFYAQWEQFQHPTSLGWEGFVALPSPRPRPHQLEAGPDSSPAPSHLAGQPGEALSISEHRGFVPCKGATNFNHQDYTGGPGG